MTISLTDSFQRKTELSSRKEMEFLIRNAPEMGYVERIFSDLYVQTGLDESVPSTRDFVGQEKRMLEEM
jgi:hypothetical protein